MHKGPPWAGTATQNSLEVLNSLGVSLPRSRLAFRFLTKTLQLGSLTGRASALKCHTRDTSMFKADVLLHLAWGSTLSILGHSQVLYYLLAEAWKSTGRGVSLSLH